MCYIGKKYIQLYPLKHYPFSLQAVVQTVAENPVIRIKKEKDTSNAVPYAAIPDSDDDDKTSICEVVKREKSTEYQTRNIKTENSSDCEIILDSNSDDNETYVSAKEQASESDSHKFHTEDHTWSEENYILYRSPSKLPRLDEEIEMSPTLARTPVKTIILKEEIIISPEASRRLVDIQTQLPYLRKTSHGSSSSGDSPISRFNMTLMSLISDSPAGSERSPTRHPFKPNKMNFTVVQDSPVVEGKSPEPKSCKLDRTKNICVVNSVENSPAIEMKTNVLQVKDSVENTPENHCENYATSDSKVSSRPSRDCLNDSNKENSVIRDEDIVGIGSPKKAPITWLSLNQCEKNNSMLSKDLDMSRNDSPIQTVSQNKKKQRVILYSSDDDIATDPSRDKSYTRIISSDSKEVESEDSDDENSDDSIYSNTNTGSKRSIANSESGDESDGFIVDSVEESEGEDISEEYSNEEVSEDGSDEGNKNIYI